MPQLQSAAAAGLRIADAIKSTTRQNGFAAQIAWIPWLWATVKKSSRRWKLCSDMEKTTAGNAGGGQSGQDVWAAVSGSNPKCIDSCSVSAAEEHTHSHTHTRAVSTQAMVYVCAGREDVGQGCRWPNRRRVLRQLEKAIQMEFNAILIELHCNVFAVLSSPYLFLFPFLTYSSPLPFPTPAVRLYLYL